MNKKFIGIVLAKKNSQRLKKKNLIKINQKFLTEYPLIALSKSKFVSNFILSSNSKYILSLGKKYKKCKPQIRPEKFCNPKSTSLESIFYIIDKNHLSDDTFLVLLEPTSPLTSHKDVDKCINIIMKNKVNSLVSIGRCKSIHPQYCFEIKKNNFPKKSINLPLRQEIKDYFYLDGSIYISRISELKKYKNFLNKKTYCYEFNKIKNLEIDDKEDLKIIKKILS